MRAIIWSLVFSACIPHQVEVTKFPTMEVKNPPRPYCWLDEAPIPPEEVSLIMEENDIVRRVFVHAREYNELVMWAKASTSWMTDLRVCLQNQVFE